MQAGFRRRQPPAFRLQQIGDFRLLRRNPLATLLGLLPDLHQPLHVGRTEDQGGNLVTLQWFDKATNLHALWDEAMVEFEKFSYTEYAKLLDVLTPEERKKVQQGTYLDWANESQELRADLYPSKDALKLGYAYHYKFKPLLRQRLQEGGLRLALIINNVFEERPLTANESKLREDIAKMPTRP